MLTLFAENFLYCNINRLSCVRKKFGTFWPSHGLYNKRVKAKKLLHSKKKGGELMGQLFKPNVIQQWVKEGQDILFKLTDKEAKVITAYIVNLVLADVKRGLEGEEPSPLFQAIDEEYRKASKGCYFHDNDIDGNETEFNLDSHLCLFCMVKLANILQAFGISPGCLFPHMSERGVQKTRLHPVLVGH